MSSYYVLPLIYKLNKSENQLTSIVENLFYENARIEIILKTKIFKAILDFNKKSSKPINKTKINTNQSKIKLQ